MSLFPAGFISIILIKCRCEPELLARGDAETKLKNLTEVVQTKNNERDNALTMAKLYDSTAETPGISAGEKIRYMDLALTFREKAKIINIDIEELKSQITVAEAVYSDAAVNYYECSEEYNYKP